MSVSKRFEFCLIAVPIYASIVLVALLLLFANIVSGETTDTVDETTFAYKCLQLNGYILILMVSYLWIIYLFRLISKWRKRSIYKNLGLGFLLLSLNMFAPYVFYFLIDRMKSRDPEVRLANK